MTTKPVPVCQDIKIRFDCLGKIVTVLPSPSFWPLAKGTIFELQKYQTENKTPRKPIFVSLSAKTFCKYLIPIFDLGYTDLSGNGVTMRNVRRVVKIWVTESVLWEALLNSRSTTFLGNVLQSSAQEASKLGEYIFSSRSYFNNTKFHTQYLDLGHEIRFYPVCCSVGVEVGIVSKHDFHTSHMMYICNRCYQEHDYPSQFKECTTKEIIIISHDEARNIEFYSVNVKLTPEIEQLALKTFLEAHPENEKIYQLVYK